MVEKKDLVRYTCLNMSGIFIAAFFVITALGDPTNGIPVLGISLVFLSMDFAIGSDGLNRRLWERLSGESLE